MKSDAIKKLAAAGRDPNWPAGDFVIAGVIMVFAVLMFVGAYFFPYRARMGVITSAGFTPMLLSGLVFVLGLALIIVTRVTYGPVSIKIWLRTALADERIRRSFVLIGITFVYVFVVGRVPFWAANITYLTTMYWYLHLGKLWKIVTLGVLSGLFVSFVIPYIFQMPLP